MSAAFDLLLAVAFEEIGFERVGAGHLQQCGREGPLALKCGWFAPELFFFFVRHQLFQDIFGQRVAVDRFNSSALAVENYQVLGCGRRQEGIFALELLAAPGSRL